MVFDVESQEISALNENDLDSRRFPRTANYDLAWLTEGSFGANPLWLAEWLCEDLDLKAGMRVLDLGCGRAKTSIFLAKEFQVEVCAVDLWIDADENARRVQEAGVEHLVTCLHAEANNLPFAFRHFDAALAFDSIQYFGTDTLWLPYIIQHLKTGGLLGFASAGVVKEMHHPVPEHLKRFWVSDAWSLRTCDWWRDHWQRTGLVDVHFAETMSDGWKWWLNWAEACDCPDWYLDTIEEDAGSNLCYIRALARRAESAVDLTHNLRTGKRQ